MKRNKIENDELKKNLLISESILGNLLGKLLIKKGDGNAS